MEVVVIALVYFQLTLVARVTTYVLMDLIIYIRQV